jgi:signal transduction histidine kinase
VHEIEKSHLPYFTSLKKIEHFTRTQMKAENEEKILKMHAQEMKILIGNVAHDLKTPVQGMFNNLEILSKLLEQYRSTATSDSDLIFETLHSSDSICKFLTVAINRCVDYSKSNSGILLVAKNETVDLQESAMWAIDCIRGLQHSVAVSFQGCDECICSHVITDKHWLQENIFCYLSNAIKHTPDDGLISVSCKLQSLPSGKQNVVVSVEDTGIGISHQVQQNLFQPFQQGMRMAGGTGLGLYSLSKRVEALNGEYGVRDRHDGIQGSCFWFSFPYKADSVAAQEYLTENPTVHKDVNVSLNRTKMSPEISPKQQNR